LEIKAPGKFRIVMQFHSIPGAFNFDGRNLKPTLIREAKEVGRYYLQTLADDPP